MTLVILLAALLLVSLVIAQAVTAGPIFAWTEWQKQKIINATSEDELTV
jgi:hypothetical protein